MLCGDTSVYGCLRLQETHGDIRGRQSQAAAGGTLSLDDTFDFCRLPTLSSMVGALLRLNADSKLGVEEVARWKLSCSASQKRER
jgi:hypothetical protein